MLTVLHKISINHVSLKKSVFNNDERSKKKKTFLYEIVMPIIMCLYLITAGHLIIFFFYISTLAPLSASLNVRWVENAKFNKHLCRSSNNNNTRRISSIKWNGNSFSVRCVVCCVRTYENNDLVMKKNIMSKRAISRR